MLVIKNSQVRSLVESADEKYIDDLVRHFTVRHPEYVSDLPERVLRQRVRAGVARGKRHGFTWRSALCGFVTIMFQVGPNFDRHPAFRRELAAGRGNPDQNARIKSLCRNVTDDEWEEAQEFEDESAWLEGSGL